MRLLNVTFDHTCIVDLEKGNRYAASLRKLIHMHDMRQINLRVVAISASELKPDNTYYSTFTEFKQRITRIGLDNATVLPTLARLDMCFFDYCVFGGGWLDELEKEIQKILFPNEIEYGDFLRIHGRKEKSKEAWRGWVRHKCDVLAMWSHIWYNGDIFVTRDTDYFRDEISKQKLIRLGAGKIWEPYVAVKMLDC